MLGIAPPVRVRGLTFGLTISYYTVVSGHRTANDVCEHIQLLEIIYLALNQPSRKSSRGRKSRASSKPAPKRRRRSVFQLVRNICLLVLGSVCSLAVGVVVFWFVKSPSFRQAANVAVTGGLAPEKAFPGAREINVLLLGKDEDRDNKSRVLKTKARTDTILLAHIDFDGKLMNLLSIPRDTLARIPGYRGRHKINAANAYGGPELTMQTVEKLTGVKPTGYVLLDYKVFQDLIDQAGGVAVNVKKQMDYDDNWGNLHIHLKPGPQILDGRQALGLVRYRKSNDGRADTDQERIERQHQLLSSARAQFTKPAMLVRLPQILDTVMRQTQTTLTPDQAFCLAYFGKQIGGNIRMEVLPTHPSRSALRVDTGKSRDLVDELFFRTPSNTIERNPG